ncbi:MAG: hypothetical protein COT80_02340 [Candidatus Buchananbacteria bacterium CG10_big_fil_rev_8_21_14_0_10_33_19]|uniref:Uncharacterized protein n=1 Tax=Candidatus Buchananbacteria bacterium CG10_big_fil_rev_8_21_14_0_10_33_19 TaxID=1974525 RepID=A0A2H0W436_9BACT|nr:MAG: hypothetical protein COT80_02340 [Candidatus Buchananbacteria bacterium CG10_big_fil_rev_8_21_14_0_10_33_19]
MRWIILGIIGLGLGWYLPLEKWHWIVLFFVGLAWWLFNIFNAGNIKFWKLAGRYPNEAYEHFRKYPETWIVAEGEIKNVHKYLRDRSPEFKGKWDGPFRLAIPYLPNPEQAIHVHIYGKVGEYEKSQNEFVSLMEKLEEARNYDNQQKLFKTNEKD